jgi:hypothetical protein
MAVRFGRLRGRGIAAGADRPHRLIRDDELDELFGCDAVESVANLPIEHGERLVALALIERFADADDRREAAGKRSTDLPIHGGVRFPEQRAPLGVADDDVFGAGSRIIGALISPVNAPSRSQCRSCAAMPTLLLRAASAAREVP